ncbi:MAG: Na(+)-translocating NADH-quinone reductase subunit C [Planctomycetes bacterium]|nr:Na(+)-translocating NADH-quinone reductase subunit C [Planctomycetota bacterium]
MHKDSIGKILFVAIALCAVCAVIVSIASVGLRPYQEKNKSLDLKRNVLLAIGAVKQGESVSGEKIEELFSKLTPRLVELGTDHYVDASPEEIAEFNPIEAAKKPETSVVIPPAKDIAGIKRRAKLARIYTTEDGRLILPIYGKGLWSTMFAYLAVQPNAQHTIDGLVYYQHGETPGLGGEVDNPLWRGQFVGKKVLDGSGKYRLEVLKGTGNKLDEYSADGMSGATITTRGVDNMLEYWLGPDCFGPLLATS